MIALWAFWCSSPVQKVLWLVVASYVLFCFLVSVSYDTCSKFQNCMSFCSTLGGSHGVPRAHFKGRQGDYYVMVIFSASCCLIAHHLVCTFCLVVYYLLIHDADMFWNIWPFTGHGYAWAQPVGCLELVRPGVRCSSCFWLFSALFEDMGARDILLLIMYWCLSQIWILFWLFRAECRLKWWLALQ
jgi:hypothetical protein